jgi:hypothetical protein
MWFLTLFQCCTFTGIISLHTNQLSGPIPSDLGSLSSLREFYMAPDGVWCSYYIVLPLCLFANGLALFVSCPFSNVVHSFTESLFLQTNQLSGPIPNALGDLTNLRKFDMLLDRQVWWLLQCHTCYLLLTILLWFVSCPNSNVVCLQKTFTCTTTVSLEVCLLHFVHLFLNLPFVLMSVLLALAVQLRLRLRCLLLKFKFKSESEE